MDVGLPIFLERSLMDQIYLDCHNALVTDAIREHAKQRRNLQE